MVPNLQRLIPRVIGLMTIALLPLGAISVWQTNAVIREAHRITQAGVLLETVAYAGTERELLQRALGAATGLASVPLALDAQDCAAVMRQVFETNPQFAFVGFVPLDGEVTCSSADRVIDLSDLPEFDRDVRRETPAIGLNTEGAASGQSVIILSAPVRSGTDVIGQLSVSLPKSAVRARLREILGPSDNIALASVTPDGTVIAASEDLEAVLPLMPGAFDWSMFEHEGEATFQAVAANGEERIYAVAELIDNTLYLVGSAPAVTAAGTPIRAQWWLAMVFPVIMWGTGVGVAVLGLQRLVLRHVRSLRSAMRQFALGQRSQGELELDNPPLELEEAARSFNRMARVVAEAEARREADLHDKEILLKEVHHRVKNNLQLIASIMNMQARQARSHEARTMLAGLQRRVRGLAMLHRTLYTTPNLTTIDARDLIETVIAEAASLTDRPDRITSELDGCPLYPDQAVPLSMLVAEALTNAVKHADADRLATTPIRIVLEQHAESVVRLRITNPVRTEPNEAAEGDGLGSQLMTAFVRQLDGTCQTGIRDGLYTFDLTFKRRAFEADPDG